MSDEGKTYQVGGQTIIGVKASELKQGDVIREFCNWLQVMFVEHESFGPEFVFIGLGSFFDGEFPPNGETVAVRAHVPIVLYSKDSIVAKHLPDGPTTKRSITNG